MIEWINRILLTNKIKALNKNIKTVKYPDNYYIIINNEYQIFRYVSPWDVIPYNKWRGNVLWRIDHSKESIPKWVWSVAKRVRKFNPSDFACIIH